MKQKRILVIGGGGREHALVWALAQSPQVEIIYCAPGNGGTALESKCLNVNVPVTDIDKLVAMAESQRFDLTVVGPEGPLIDGIVDRWPNDLLIWGPNAQAAQLEGSKIRAKEEMDKHGVPTAWWVWFDDSKKAHDWLDCQPEDQGWVVKANGQALGKGVKVCKDRTETHRAIDAMASFDEAGKRFIIEEKLEGVEASFFLLCSRLGQVVTFGTAKDYKRAQDGDKGENTGGMGCYSPAKHLTEQLQEEIMLKLHPLISAMDFTGFLYVGLMLTPDGWFILEFNVRLGDPEAQVILPRLKSDLFDILHTMAASKYHNKDVIWSDNAAVTTVMTAGGYPGSYRKGDEIFGLDDVPTDVIVYHAGTRLDTGILVTNGGRILAVTGRGPDIPTARRRSYRGVRVISWADEYHRRDIARGVE